MAFKRYANAVASRHGVPFDEWMEVLRSQNEGVVPKDYVHRVAKTVLRRCDPNQYLLSHATIVASVDTYAPKGAKTGRFMNRGVQVDVRWPDYRIKPECQNIINNNGDGWDRSLLLSTYRTFVGAQNYCFVPETKILMSDGTQRSISDISVGDEVIGGSGLPRKVVHKHVRDYEGEVKLIYVGHRKTPIVCTPNHPFARLDKTECLDCGKRLNTSNRPSSYKQRLERDRCNQCSRKVRNKTTNITPTRVAASDLEPRAILFAPKPKLVSSSVKERDSIRFARLMGFYLSEGCLTKHDGRPTGVIFTVGSHETDFIQQILDCVRAVEPEARPTISNSRVSDHCVYIKVHNSKLARELHEACGSLAHQKKISTEWINSSSPEEILNLIGAYISGDADVHKVTQRIRACSVSLDLLQQIQFLASTINLSGFIVESSVKVGDVRVISFADGTKHEATSRHQAHVLHFDVQSSKIICEYATSHKYQKRPVSAGDLKFYDDKRITYVNKIETDIYKGKVFNLEVEEDHSYIVDGTVQVFNCEHIQLPELSKGFIVDAVARDLGSSCYIDILVATDKKHKQLVSDILSGSMNSLSMGCHKPGTQVYLDDGSTINIEDVRPDMRVLSQKGRSCRVDNLQIRENRWRIRRVKTVGLPVIESTDNHKYYFVPSERIERYKKSGHNPAAVVQRDYDFEYQELKNVKVGDYLATPIQREIIRPNVSLAEARLLGLWVGDGWKFENKHDSTVGIGLCMDEAWPEIIDDAEKTINQISWANNEMRMTANGSVPKVVSKQSRRGASYLLSTSRAVRNIIDSHVTGRTALTKVINRDIMCWPREHQLAFLGGLIDSDGCVSTRKGSTNQVHISTRNRSLAHQYYQILARCGMISSISSARRTGTKLLPNASGTDYQLRLRNDDVKRIPSLKIERVKDKLKSSITGLNDRWITENYLYTKVKKIEEFDYEGFVYDLQVDVDHSYVANGVGVSNCISAFTICSKCGNVAADDSQLCPCIQYDGKHTEYYDEDGQKHKIAELIGHVSVPNSNQFIEASWVKNPAFRGAVRRNFLNPNDPQLASIVESSFNEHEARKLVQVPDGLARAASVRVADQGQDQGASGLDQVLEESGGQDQGADTEEAQDEGSGGQDQDEGQDKADQGAEAKKSESKIDELLEKAQEQVLTMLVDKLGERLAPKPEDVGSVAPPVNLESSNQNLVRSSEEFARRLRASFPNSPGIIVWARKAWETVHEGGLPAIRKSSLTPKDLLVLSWIEDQVGGRKFPIQLYKLAMKTGPITKYPSETSYIASCSMNAGRQLTASEKKFLTWKGRIASLSGK